MSRAKNGEGGMGKEMTGANGDDAVMRVPVGTQIYEEDGETLIADLATPGERVLLLKGGNGGFGNAHFKSATNQAPRHANPGQPGEEKTIILKLKLIADVGLIGMPNAGKSTFLSRVSAARPKIADYPFTTLVPQLGVVRIDSTDFVLADLPGLIEGAHEGVGLGDRFSVMPNAAARSCISSTARRARSRKTYKTIRGELEAYGHGLDDKPEIVALNKIDAIPKAALAKKRASLEKACGRKVFVISGVSRRRRGRGAARDGARTSPNAAQRSVEPKAKPVRKVDAVTRSRSSRIRANSSSSRSVGAAGRCRDRHAAPRLAAHRSAPTSPSCAARARTSSSSHPAPSRSAVVRSKLKPGVLQAGGKPGRSRRGPGASRGSLCGRSRRREHLSPRRFCSRLATQKSAGAISTRAPPCAH